MYVIYNKYVLELNFPDLIIYKHKMHYFVLFRGNLKIPEKIRQELQMLTSQCLAALQYIYIASMTTHQGDSRVPTCHLDNLSGIPH